MHSEKIFQFDYARTARYIKRRVCLFYSAKIYEKERRFARSKHLSDSFSTSTEKMKKVYKILVERILVFATKIYSELKKDLSVLLLIWWEYNAN